MTVYELNEIHNKEIAEPCTKSEDGFWHNVRKYLREYAEVTGIHGFRYVAEKRSAAEKIIWSLALIFSLGGCIYMISKILDKYESSPVVLSFAAENIPLFEIPFPAVTICPDIKYNTQAFNYTDIVHRLKHDKSVDKTNLTMFHHLSVVCDDIHNTSKFESKTLDNGFFETIHETKMKLADIFTFCIYQSEENCEELFTPIITDAGLCYSFNIFGGEDISHDHV
ncbi:pickpocket protein 28-like [Zophobas morio]|uniref:pickpocket protein 28-like n=1 Tax=Zophobas morio TaxID=2755281 RepID=UPI0030829526